MARVTRLRMLPDVLSHDPDQVARPYAQALDLVTSAGIQTVLQKKVAWCWTGCYSSRWSHARLRDESNIPLTVLLSDSAGLSSWGCDSRIAAWSCCQLQLSSTTTENLLLITSTSWHILKRNLMLRDSQAALQWHVDNVHRGL